MATSRDRRRLAFQALYQLDIHEGDRDRAVAAWVEEAADFAQDEREAALALASAAYQDRQRLDGVLKRLAPAWPAERQPAVDRAILRLALYEFSRQGAPGKVIINDAVELAKDYSTEKSPKFINAVLDAAWKESAPPRRNDEPRPPSSSAPGAA